MRDIKLQVALDFLELSRALKVAEAAVRGGADYIEAGTPLIKSEGLGAVRALREYFPKNIIIADMKTMDTGRLETEAAAKAGADIISVSGTASIHTIEECVIAGKRFGIQIAVDLLGVKEPAEFVKELKPLGVSWINIHCPIDSQMHGQNPFDLLKAIRALSTLTCAIAGGINSETAAIAAAEGADVIIVGGAITKAIDPEKAAREIRKAIDTKKGVSTKLFKRSDESNIRKMLSSVRTSHVSDGSHRKPSLFDLKPLQTGYSVCGPVVTVRTLAGDWAKPVEAIDVAKPGDIIVIDASGNPPAVWGELATESAKIKGIIAVIIYGAVRDTADIRKLGFPVWAKHISSHAGDPHGIGEINEPISVCGQRIYPGDWVVADDDGVIIIPKKDAVEMTNRAQDVLENENRIRQEIRDGKTSLAKVLNLLRWEKKAKSPHVG